MNAALAREPLELKGLPKLDRFFPSCLLGAVELVARVEFHVPDIKKCWFGNTFTYHADLRGNWRLQNGCELPVFAGVLADTQQRALVRLDKYYGVEVQVREVSSLEESLANITASLRRGVPAITSFILPRHPERPQGRFRPHYVLASGYEPRTQRLKLLDSVRGELDVSVADYAAAFEQYRANGQSFTFVDCSCRTPGVSRPIERHDAILELARSLENLTSFEKSTGLTGFGCLLGDLSEAYAALEEPFYVPGLWIFSHDRNCLRRALPYWREAFALGSSLVDKLDGLLARSFELWFRADMSIESDLVRRDGSMQQALLALQRLVDVEHQLAVALFDLFGCLQNAAERRSQPIS